MSILIFIFKKYININKKAVPVRGSSNQVFKSDFGMRGFGTAFFLFFYFLIYYSADSDSCDFSVAS